MYCVQWSGGVQPRRPALPASRQSPLPALRCFPEIKALLALAVAAAAGEVLIYCGGSSGAVNRRSGSGAVGPGGGTAAAGLVQAAGAHHGRRGEGSQ